MEQAQRALKSALLRQEGKTTNPKRAHSRGRLKPEAVWEKGGGAQGPISPRAASEAQHRGSRAAAPGFCSAEPEAVQLTASPFTRDT